MNDLNEGEDCFGGENLQMDAGVGCVWVNWCE